MNPLSNTQYRTHLLMLTQSSVLLITILLICLLHSKNMKNLIVTPPIQNYLLHYNFQFSLPFINKVILHPIQILCYQSTFTWLFYPQSTHQLLPWMEFTTVLHSMQRKFDHLIPQYNIIYPLPLLPPHPSLHLFNGNTGMPSLNQNIFDPTTMSTHYANTPVSYTTR